MVSTSKCLSRRQRLVIGFLFLVMMGVSAQSLTYSVHYPDVSNMPSDQLVYSIENGSITRRIGFVALLIGALLMMAGARNDGPHSSALRNNLPLAFFVGLAFLSVLWSSDPELTFRRSSEYLLFCIGAAAAGRSLGMRGVVWLAFLGSTGYLVIGLISEVVLGTFHPFSVDYRFCGTTHPNHEAWICILLLISGSALLSEIRSLWRVAYFMAMTLGVVCLFLTKSRTSLVCGAFALMFYWAGRLSRKQMLGLALAGTLLVSVLFAVTLVRSGEASKFDRMLLAGRDVDSYQNFTGRLPLWNLSMGYVGVRPLAGYGFDSFWTPDHVREISAEEGWSVPHSHNGLIELLLSLGAIGLTLYLYQLAGTWLLLRRSYKATGDPLVRFYLALFIFYFGCMFAESIGFDCGLATFCLLSMLWCRKSWFLKQFAPVLAERTIPVGRPMQAHQSLSS